VLLGAALALAAGAASASALAAAAASAASALGASLGRDSAGITACRFLCHSSLLQASALKVPTGSTGNYVPLLFFQNKSDTN
jgi:hypothetical protein